MKPRHLALALSFAMAFVMAAAAFAQLYIWTDKDGVKHVTNTAPPPEAENVEAEPEATYQPPDPGTRSRENIQRSRQRTQELKDRYERRQQKRIDEYENQRPKLYTSGYEISGISVSVEEGDTIRVTGRINGGPPCKKLNVDLYLHGDSGALAHMMFNVKNTGGSASRLFEARDWVGSTRAKGAWHLNRVYYHCLE